MLIKMQHFPGSAGIHACLALREKGQAGMPALPGGTALPGRLTHKRPQNTPQREDLSRVDGLVDDARDQLL